MTVEEFQQIKRLLLPIMRVVDELRAAENARLHVLHDLFDSGLVSPEAAEILDRYDQYCRDEQETAHLDLEQLFPELAAELDRGRDEPPFSSHDEKT